MARRFGQFLLAAVALCPALAFGDINTWSGASSSVWSDAANWNGRVPVNGDSAVFPPNALRFTLQNDLLGLTLDAISITNAVYTLGADPNHPLTLHNLIADAGANGSTLNLPLVLDPNAGLVADISSGATLTFRNKFTGGGR